MRDDMHPRRIEPDEERLIVASCLVDECEGVAEDFVIHGLHSFGTQLSRVLNPLLPDLTPTRLNGGVVHISCPSMDHVAWTHPRLEGGRIVTVTGVLHRIQMIEVAKELFEPMQGRQELV